MTAVAERAPAWARGGTNVQGLSFPEAIERAGIGFEVQTCPARAAIPTDPGDPSGNYSIQPIRDRQHTYRTDTLLPLGDVGPRYHVVQTRQIQGFVEEIVGGGWQPEWAAPFRGGRAVFIVGRLPFPTSEEVSPYLAVVNSFDGSSGLRLANTPIRPACTNAIKRTFARASAAISIRHTVNLSARVEDVRQALKLSQAYYERLENEISALIMTQLDEDRISSVLDLLYEFKPSKEKEGDLRAVERNEQKRAQFRNHWQTTPTLDRSNRETAWGLLQATTEWEQWHSRNSGTPKFSEAILGAQLGLMPAVTKADRVQRLILGWEPYLLA